METLWFVLMTVIVTSASVDGQEPAYVPGDVLTSSLLGGAETEDKCKEGAKILAGPIQAASGGSAVVVWNCVEMDAAVGEAQGFTAVKPSDDR
jgi:hypothetical protein